MPTPEETAEAVAGARTWDARVAVIRKVPEAYGTAQHASVYSAIAARVFVPHLTPEFGYVHWREEYELPPLQAVYRLAHDRTEGFNAVTRARLAATLEEHPETLRVFRLLLGLILPEFAEACAIVAEGHHLEAVGKGRISSAESGGHLDQASAITCATVIDLAMSGALFPPAESADGSLRSKLTKPDTVKGWESVRHYAKHGVPLEMLFHQRQYGGAFRQLLDATSAKRRGYFRKSWFRNDLPAINGTCSRTGHAPGCWPICALRWAKIERIVGQGGTRRPPRHAPASSANSAP